MKMNVRFMIDHDEGHCTSLVKMGSYHMNKDEDWDGFYKSDDVKIRRQYGISYDKFMLLQAYYKMDCEAETELCYRDEGWDGKPSFTLDEFINLHKKMSVNELNRIVYSD